MSNSDPNPDEQYCPSCGETIPKESTFCPECGVNVSEPESKSKEGLFSVLSIDKTEASIIVFSLLVFFGAFLNWGTNSVVTVTGLDTGFGYITIILSLTLVFIAQKSKNKQKRMIGVLFLSSVLVAIAILSYARLSQTGLAGGGGGLSLTLFSGGAVFIGGFVGYAIETSAERVVIVALVCAFLAITFVLTTPILIHHAQVSQVEIKDESVGVVTGSYNEFFLQVRNPTGSSVNANIQYTITKHGGEQSDPTEYVYNNWVRIEGDWDHHRTTPDDVKLKSNDKTCNASDLPCKYDGFTLDIKIKPLPPEQILFKSDSESIQSLTE